MAKSFDFRIKYYWLHLGQNYLINTKACEILSKTVWPKLAKLSLDMPINCKTCQP